MQAISPTLECQLPPSLLVLLHFHSAEGLVEQDQQGGAQLSAKRR